MIVVVVVVRFVNEKRARNEQLKERRENECERRRAAGRREGGREGCEGGHLCVGGSEMEGRRLFVFLY